MPYVMISLNTAGAVADTAGAAAAVADVAAAP